MESLLEQSNIVRQKGRYWRKIRNITVLVFLCGFIIGGWISYYYPYSKGIRTGELEQVVFKGFIFKTNEGLLILSENESDLEGNTPSNKFEFSIAKNSKAEKKLIEAWGNLVDIHYTEYFKAIPWRGSSRFIVDDFVTIYNEKAPFEKELIAGETTEERESKEIK